MGKRQSISAGVKKEIMKFLEEGRTLRNIAAMLSLSQPSVSNIVKQCKIDKCLTSHKKGTGRPTISNTYSDRILGRIIRKEPFQLFHNIQIT